MQESPDNQDPETQPASVESVDGLSLQGEVSAEKPKPESTYAPFATSMNVRMGLAFYGILVPIACHLITVHGAPESAEWQSGELSDKLSFVLSGRCGWPVFPFLIFAMVCLGMVVRDETRAFAKPWVRYGVFSGTIVCSWYLFVFSLTVMDSVFTVIGLLIGAAVWLLLVHGVIWLLVKFNAVPIVAMIAGGFVLLIMTSAITGDVSFFGILMLPILIVVILSTPLAFLTYLAVSIRMLKLHAPSRRFTLADLMIWVTWLATFSSAIRSTIKLSMYKYSQLPLEPPEGCYVATAASKGYPRIVGSHRLSTAGQPMVVNSQLATFKAAELTLRAVSPAGHRAFRFVYNRVGPVAAGMLVSPMVATVAYLCLKPAEWICWVVLGILLGRKTLRQSLRLYHSRAKQVKP